jgi:photosystem II stability/assembly factor-like uncharacterized protein
VADCLDEKTCVTVGEATDGPDKGCRVLRTTDGGKDWTTTYTNATCGLFDVRQGGG